MAPPHDGHMQTKPGQPTQIRVVVVDADDRVRESLAGLLRIDGRIEVVGSSGRSDTALDLVGEARPDIIIVDPRLPDMDGGRDFIHRLRTTSPGVRVLVMVWAGVPEDADLADSCDGFVRKTFRPSDLISAIFAASAASTPAIPPTV
jgi:DNA-binding NarL/FixJ family response regulator